MSEQVEVTEIPSYTRMTGEIYDLIYADKDYANQSAKLVDIIEQRLKSGGNAVLEAACGTGTYMQFLKDKFAVSGFDLSQEQIKAAKKRLPELDFFVADMADFDTGQLYDAVVCLFSSIGYLQTKEALDSAVVNMAKHTKPGGLIIIEPWLKAENFEEGHISLETSSNNKMTVARMGVSSKEGNVSVLQMHHMIGTSSGVEHFLETHKLAMYSDDDFTNAFTKAGLEIEIDPEGLTGRGLYIGKKPLDQT
jgi:SAM-dependent methyltransferase